jgi:hypothetical protein
MNTTPDIALQPRFTPSAASIEDCVRKHPGGTLLLAAGIGIAAMLLARALQPPPPPRNMAVRLLEDIQQRLNHLAEQGSHALNQGADSVGELHLERKFDKLCRSFKNLFH